MPYPCVCRMTLCFILILVLQDDDNDDGLLTTGGEAAKERREYGTISWAVYWQYLKVGDIISEDSHTYCNDRPGDCAFWGSSSL